MTGLPKFVREQMGRSPAPVTHPDADVLTAFAENILAGKERQQIVDHLAACSECREVVFLAQPESVETQTVLASKPRRFTWMAWASVAAVVVVVASAVILQREQVTKVEAPVTVATTPAPPPPESIPVEAPGKSASEAPLARAQGREEALARKSANEVPRRTNAANEPLIMAGAADETVDALKAPSANPSVESHQNVAVGGLAPQQTVVGPDRRILGAQMQQQAQGPSNSANTNLVTTNQTFDRDQNVAKDELATAAKTKKQARPEEFHGAAAGYAPTVAGILPAVRTRWQISSSGTLERSFSADQWTPVLAETGAKFRVVSVIGNTVWAGGEHGALYVSRDGGITWNPVKIDTAETIASIRFSNDSNGTLQTSDGRLWKTTDGGKTWQKQ